MHVELSTVCTYRETVLCTRSTVHAKIGWYGQTDHGTARQTPDSDSCWCQSGDNNGIRTVVTMMSIVMTMMSIVMTRVSTIGDSC